MINAGWNMASRSSNGLPAQPMQRIASSLIWRCVAVCVPPYPVMGETLRFEDAQGTTVLTYSGLKVWDVGGHDLPARFVADGGGVRLLVDERGAHYPITVDPFAQQAYVKASNTDGGDEFGFSVAVSGDTVVVGAAYESSNATGINGDQNDNSALNAGAAYVFVRNGTDLDPASLSESF